MKLLLKSATIIDRESKYHRQQLDILIEDGRIKEIEKSIKTSVDKTIKNDNLHVSRGWFDSSVNFGEPGYEERETIANGLDTAGKSGFTTVALNTNTNPAPDNSSAINAIKSKSTFHPVKLLPLGNLSVKGEGVDLAELYDMQQHGAVSFSDYQKPLRNPNLLKIALQYAQNFKGLIQSFPMEKRISNNGLVNEHHQSTRLGLKGIPNLAEELQITRDLYLLEYTGGKLHIPTISTKKSAQLIKEAKKKGLDVSCSVALHNIFYTDDLLEEFNTNAKVLPPLRISEDVKALRKALKDGTIDMLTTDHNPIDSENKKVEFDNAMFGTIGLETAFGALNQIFELEESIAILNRGRERFGEENPEIKEGAPVNLSLFEPSEAYTFKKEHIFSTSHNSIFLGEKLKGKSLGIITEKGDFLV